MNVDAGKYIDPKHLPISTPENERKMAQDFLQLARLEEQEKYRYKAAAGVWCVIAMISSATAVAEAIVILWGK